MRSAKQIHRATRSPDPMHGRGEDNKAVLRRFFDEVVNGGRLDQAGEFVTPDYVEHRDLPGAGGDEGIEIAKGFLSLMRSAFPDFHFDVEDLIAEGDKVAARVEVSGRHSGEFMGVPPTGRLVKTSGIEVVRFENRRMAEHWATFDALAMIRQLGIVPMPTPPLLVRMALYHARKVIPRLADRLGRS